MKIDVYSHSFMVSELNERQKKAVAKYCKTLIQYEMVIEDGRKEMQPSKVFASASPDRESFRFHINSKVGFFRTLECEQIPSSEIHIVKHEIDLSDRFKVEFIVKDIFSPRDDQPDIIQRVLAPGNNKVVTAQPGFGKTLVTKHCMIEQGLRTMVCMRGGYIDRWEPDLEKTFKLKRGELYSVRGSKPLIALMEMALDNEPIGHVNLISTNTFVSYLKDFEKEGTASGFPIAPIDFFDKLGIGFGVLDEAHQNPHQVMKMFSYMNIHKFLSLSATLNTRDPFMDNMYQLMFPRAERIEPSNFKTFILVRAIKFNLKNPKAVRYKGFGGAYNHSTFEASLLIAKNKKLFETYVNMIDYYVSTNFIDIYEKGLKAIVFCGTVKMCEILTKWFSKKYPRISSTKYTAKEKMSVLDRADLIFSTVLSAGTAVDIPGLCYSLMTTAIDSQQSNDQTLGRTRELIAPWKHMEPVFHYFVCLDIPSHVKYHENKMEAFKGRVKSHGMEFAPFTP